MITHNVRNRFERLTLVFLFPTWYSVVVGAWQGYVLYEIGPSLSIVEGCCCAKMDCPCERVNKIRRRQRNEETIGANKELW